MKLAEAGIIALATGLALGLIGRAILRSRVRLTLAEATLSGIVGAVIGGGLSTLIFEDPDQPRLGVVAIGAIAGTVCVLLLVDRFVRWRRQVRLSVRELIAGGETSQVEFKSTARYNLHSARRDERIEAVIVKTIAAFANSEGGCLLIGVSDDGEVLGLGKDLALMKRPDNDRFELWLRDSLSTAIGVVAAGDVAIEFPAIDGEVVCLARVDPASRPVFVSLPKEKRRAMYVRTGNSTRELEVDEALAYCSRRWGRRSLRAALR